MRSFKEHLQESVKKYDFRIKIAGDFSSDKQKQLESLLSKYKIASFKKAGTTPVQKFPLDFPKLTNEEVNIYEVSLDYPTTQFELTNYIAGQLGIATECLVVRKPGEPVEEYQSETPVRSGESVLLSDPDYKEAPNHTEDVYGDKYNSAFLKELNDILKLQRKERGEVIPNAKADQVITAENMKTTNDIPQNNSSILKQAQDPRKK